MKSANDYKMKDLHQHILDIPDTYIGGINENSQERWVYDDDSQKIIKKEVMFNQGIYKIFDETIVNSRDETIRNPTCDYIKVSITKDTICIENNGEGGIPIEKHPEYGIWVPDMIFGKLLTSDNYDTDKKIVGGKNGYGAKLTNIYSKEFNIEIVNLKNRKKYVQQFRNNMYDRDEPTITVARKNIKKCPNSYVKISFTPDFKRLNAKDISNDMMQVLKKRVYDIAACTRDNVKVYLNDELIEVKTFEDYIKMFYKEEQKITYFSDPNGWWNVGIVFDPNPGYRQISFVNGLCTIQGGTHVKHVLDIVIHKLIKLIQAKNKNLNVRYTTVKDNISIFVDATIEDPTFDSQTKALLKNPVSSFGKKCSIGDDFVKELSKTGIIDQVVGIAKFKEDALNKKTDGRKVNRVRNMPKLLDAEWAGTRRSPCTRLILTEGDSAKAFAVDGLSVIGMKKYGVFPLKGKILNVLTATQKQLLTNTEIINIKQIIGLQHGAVYEDTKKLRYGGILILTDQDDDGYHIKGLLINFIHANWPSLLDKVENFVQYLPTPIVKVTKKTDTKRLNSIPFYTQTEYHQWVAEIGDDEFKKWNAKYYKGLATHKGGIETKKCFENFDKRVISYSWNNNSREEIFKAFHKDKVPERKEWIMNYDPNKIIDNNNNKICIPDFINKELIHFSYYDCQRSLPSICDGLKPSQRKILFVAFKKCPTREIRVAQLAGAVTEKTNYHHGESSLQQAITNMAQTFVGSNNINLLRPDGQFGTRAEGGHDAGSPRYIQTALNSLTSLIFNPIDNCVLKPLYDDGMQIEYQSFAPIIPMVLVNGCKGIGTGFATNIPSYNPKDIIENIRRLINGDKFKQMTPWYRKFKGKIEQNPKNTKQYFSYGNIDTTKRKATITELPIGTWTTKYKTDLNKMLIPENSKETPTKNQILTGILDQSSTEDVCIKIDYVPSKIQDIIVKDSLITTFKLKTNINVTNMYLFNDKQIITKYETIEDIFKDYCKYRLNVYKQRKSFVTKILKNELKHLKWTKKFVEDYRNKIIVINNRTEEQVMDKLEQLGYPKLSKNIGATENEKTYNYVKMPLFSLTKEKVAELKEKYKNKSNELKKYQTLTIHDLWLQELQKFEEAYDKWLIEIHKQETM